MLASNIAFEPTIMLHGGAQFDFLDPWSSDFTIEDIAQGLSNVCRYVGQCAKFYSVAEHSLHVSQVARGHELAGLLHDAAEAFVGDMTGPLKRLLPEFKKIEDNVERAILARFGVHGPIPLEVKQADLRVLAAEQAQIMPMGTDSWARANGVVPAHITVLHLTPAQAKATFLERFRELR
jgi:hypothetical protein